MDTIRVGKISSINHKEGKARVVYSDRDNCTTVEMPLMVYNNTYRTPNVGDQVVCLHQPNGAANGFILGDYWSQTHKAHKEGGEGKTVKYFDRDGKCYLEYADTDNGGGNGGLKFHNDNALNVETKEDIEINTEQKFKITGIESIKINTDGSMELKASGSLSIEGAGGVTITGGSVTITGGTKIDGVTFLAHTHECTAPGSPSGPVNPGV
jgi:phage baseplate assembly protein V